MVSIRIVDDPGEFARYIPKFSAAQVALRKPRNYTQAVAKLDALIRERMSDPEASRFSASVAETADGQLAGFHWGALYRGSSSHWRSNGPLWVPRDKGAVPVSAATVEQWADKPISHSVFVTVRADYHGQGLGTALLHAWADARPADEQYATAHIEPTNGPSLRTFRSNGAQIIGTRDNGNYFVLTPLRGQPRDQVNLQVASIQHEMSGVDAALRGLGSPRDVASHGPRSTPVEPAVALPIETAIQRAAAAQHEPER